MLGELGMEAAGVRSGERFGNRPTGAVAWAFAVLTGPSVPRSSVQGL